MNKSILASMLIPALLAGCGSSSSGSSSSPETPATPITPTAPTTPAIPTPPAIPAPPPSPVTYQWQVVQLKSVNENSLKDSGCVIYSDSKSHDDKVITAYIAKTDYNILYHKADGSIAKTIAADEISSGLLTIAADDVPDNGYVSLEEVDSLRGAEGILKSSYMFSVQKSLLSDMVLNISQPQTGDCYAGTDHRESAASGTALVNVNVAGAHAYYQSSYNIDSVNGQTIVVSGIPVDSPYPAAHDTLITAFDTYDSGTEKKTDLSNWAFIDAEYLYKDSEDDGYNKNPWLSDEDLNTQYWSTDDTITLDGNSGIIALHEGSSYFWQPIYNDIDSFNRKLRFAYGSSEVSAWSGYFSGKENESNWLFNSFMPLTNSDVDITLPPLSAVDSIAVISSSNCSGVVADYCIDTDSHFSSSDFNYQRTHIRMSEGGYTAYQSIYSEANAEPVVLACSDIDFSAPTLDRIELNLMSSDADSRDAVQYLMVQNMDIIGMGDYGLNYDAENSDFNGYISSNTESEKLYQAILGSTTTTVMNAYEP